MQVFVIFWWIYQLVFNALYTHEYNCILKLFLQLIIGIIIELLSLFIVPLFWDLDRLSSWRNFLLCSLNFIVFPYKLPCLFKVHSFCMLFISFTYCLGQHLWNHVTTNSESSLPYLALNSRGNHLVFRY